MVSKKIKERNMSSILADTNFNDIIDMNKLEYSENSQKYSKICSSKSNLRDLKSSRKSTYLKFIDDVAVLPNSIINLKRSQSYNIKLI